MADPLVSVVVPCYNVAKTVAETIASISAQTMPDFEILAVDNNCKDDTVGILSRLAKGEPRLRIVTQPVQGLSAARNGGIEAARGKYIAFLDADDLWDANYLEKHVENLADDKVGVSYSRIRLVDNDGRPTGQVTDPKLVGLSANDLLLTNPCTALFVVRRDVFESAGLFDQDLRSVEDQEWLFRAVFHGAKLQGIGLVLASYRITPGGLSADLENMLRCHGLMLEAARRIAPDLVAAQGRLSKAAMLRYCARRAVEHGHGASAAWRYLRQMVWAAPELMWREPMTTVKVIGRVGLATFGSAPSRKVGPLEMKGA